MSDAFVSVSVLPLTDGSDGSFATPSDGVSAALPCSCALFGLNGIRAASACVPSIFAMCASVASVRPAASDRAGPLTVARALVFEDAAAESSDFARARGVLLVDACLDDPRVDLVAGLRVAIDMGHSFGGWMPSASNWRVRLNVRCCDAPPNDDDPARGRIIIVFWIVRRGRSRVARNYPRGSVRPCPCWRCQPPVADRLRPSAPCLRPAWPRP